MKSGSEAGEGDDKEKERRSTVIMLCSCVFRESS